MYLHKDDKELLRDRLLCDNDIKRTGTEKSQCGV